MFAANLSLYGRKHALLLLHLKNGTFYAVIVIDIMNWKNNLYPHLLPEDICLWESFLLENSSKFIGFDYDVRVGSGRDPGPSYNSQLRRIGIDLSQRRIDCIGYQSKSIYIFEVTMSVGLKAIGQLLTYPLLYQRTYNPTLPLVPAFVCSEIQSDILPIIESKGILYFVYNPAA